MNNLKVIGFNPRKNNGAKSGKRIQMMRKPLPFNMNFWKNNGSPLPNSDQNRENIINKYHHSPIILSRPFKKEVIRFHNKNSSINIKNNYNLYLKKNPFDDGSYDLHKANWDVSKKNKPTAKLRSIKLGNPFATPNTHKTNFGYVYSVGGIPCRIEHGNVCLKLVWDIPVEQLDYDPILITCFEGLLETEHPYNFAGKQCIRELLNAKGAEEKVIPILGRLIGPLKDALRCDNPEIFCEAMNDLEITFDGRTAFIPNGKVSDAKLINYTESPLRRIDLTFSICYSEDFKRAQALICEVISGDALIQPIPGPIVRMGRHSESVTPSSCSSANGSVQEACPVFIGVENRIVNILGSFRSRKRIR